jgi:protoporphyrinogen oxidase
MKVGKKIAIVGGGITGLVLANLLSPKHQIAIFEKESQLGGLSAGVKKNGWQRPLENFYHHFFTSDRETINLLKQLNIKYSFKRPKTATYQKNKIYQLDSASSLLTHPYLNLYQKLRAGAAIAALKLWPSAKFLEEKTAVEALPKIMGRKAYQTLWEPLLWGKFGQNMNQVGAGWFWARIKKRSQKLGYPEGGFPTLVAKLEGKIKKQGGKIFLNQEIKSLEELQDNFGKIIITTPLPVFLKIASPLPKNYQNKLKKIKHLGAINLILICQKPFLPENVYWLNINEKSFPFRRSSSTYPFC